VVLSLVLYTQAEVLEEKKVVWARSKGSCDVLE
jgi:hypothetical protein